MENNENPIANICNDNTDLFSEMTPEEDDEGDASAEEPSEIIPSTMLTPPPTGEPLLNGSSRSSTSGNDLQQFKADELTQQSPVLSHHTDEGNSNHSANSDSADSKLIINEGSIDSSDISNSKILEATTGVHFDDDLECISTTELSEIDSNQNDETLDVKNQDSQQVKPDEEVITPPLECASNDMNNMDVNSQYRSFEQPQAENCKNVPSQSMNGVIDEDDALTSSIDHIKDCRLANETHTEHRKLKRKLSDSISDLYETSQKQTKFNNQTNIIGLDDNQIIIDDSVSNHLINHDQITNNCDNSTSSDCLQKCEDPQMVLEKQAENADENFESEIAIEDLLPVTKEKNIDEPDHIYMNGHTGSKMELISSIETPHEYNQQLTLKATNGLDESIQSHALKSKVKNPFSTPPQSGTNSISDNSDEKSLHIPPEKLETNSQTDLSVEKSEKSITTMNISCNSDSNAPFVGALSENKTLDLDNENDRHPTATIIIPPHTQQDGKKINTHIRIRRQVFLCSACGTYYEKWNLFYHIREVHNKFMCLFCLGIFPNAERLVNHLESKHVHKPFVYEHKDDLIKSLRSQCFLMCCVCEHIFTENDDVTAHSCETFMKPCSVCGLKFIHKSKCSTLLSNKSSKHKQKRMAVAPNTVQHMALNSTISHNTNNISQQTFLRNALLGQEPPVNHYSGYQNAPIIAQLPMFDRRLNNAPQHQIQSQHQLQPQSQLNPQSHLQLQPQSQSQFQQALESVSVQTTNADILQQSLVKFTLLIHQFAK